MKLKRLTLENYRGFENLDLALEGASALIIGKNGAGKSTILDAVATALAPLYKEFVQDKTQLRSLDDLDIRQGETKTEISLGFETDGSRYEWKLIRDLQRSRAKYYLSGELIKLVHQLQEAALQNHISEEKDNLPEHLIPIVAYYPSSRIVTDVPFHSTLPSKQSRFLNHAWEGALSIRLDFELFFRWFRNQEDIENERRRYLHSEYIDPKLQAVREAIEGFLSNEFQNLRYTRVPVERMLIDKNGITLSVNQLSSGEKMMLALVGDLARRLAIANPGLENPLQGEGLVLIDEVEAHLHPGWQRMIINGFLRTFPNVQFLFTTHSPQVISEVRDLKMYLLQMEDGANTLRLRKPVFGQDVNYVLEAVMDSDSRNEDVKNRLYYIFRLLERNELDEAEKELKALELLLTGLEKPAEMLKAEATLLRKRTIGR